MTLEIYDQNLQKVQTAEWEMSTWDWDRIVFMSHAGYSFKLDGKWIKIGDRIDNTVICESQPDTKQIKDMTVGELQEVAKNAVDKVFDENPDLVDKMFNAVKDKVLSNQKESVNPNLKPMIECIETGKLYAKQSHAARDLGIDPAYVSDSIKTGKQHKGYSFRKVLA